MRELSPGVYHWSTFHEPIGADVSSYFVEPAGIVIDPKEPEEGLDALPSRPSQVVLTSGHHDRDSQRFADAFGIPILGSRASTRYLDGQLDMEESARCSASTSRTCCSRTASRSSVAGSRRSGSSRMASGGRAQERRDATAPISARASMSSWSRCWHMTRLTPASASAENCSAA